MGIHQNSCDACLLPATMRCDAKPADREHRRHIPLGRTHRRNFSARAKSTIMTNANATLYLCVRACAPKRSSAREEQLASLCLRARVCAFAATLVLLRCGDSGLSDGNSRSLGGVLGGVLRTYC